MKLEVCHVHTVDQDNLADGAVDVEVSVSVKFHQSTNILLSESMLRQARRGDQSHEDEQHPVDDGEDVQSKK